MVNDKMRMNQFYDTKAISLNFTTQYKMNIQTHPTPTHKYFDVNKKKHQCGHGLEGVC